MRQTADRVNEDDIGRRRGGRPTHAEAERRHDMLLKTAAELFLKHGVRGVSVDALAQTAGVAKRSIYARYADKGELFAAAIERVIEDRAKTLFAFEVPEGPAEDGLLAFGRHLVDLALKPENIAFMRLLIREAPHYPSLAKLDSDRNRQRALAAMMRVFSVYAERGEIGLDNPETLAELFWLLVVRAAQWRALILGPEDPAQAERRLKAAVRLFLDGCRRR